MNVMQLRTELAKQTPKFDELLLRDFEPLKNPIGTFDTDFIRPAWFESQEQVRRICEGVHFSPTKFEPAKLIKLGLVEKPKLHGDWKEFTGE
jgi:hypothetical protein